MKSYIFDLGTIKNAILVTMAIKKLTPKSIHNRKDANSVLHTQDVDEDESLLRDTNGYMYITFLQTILAFLMQDAPEAITQVSLTKCESKLKKVFSVLLCRQISTKLQPNRSCCLLHSIFYVTSSCLHLLYLRQELH